MSAYLCCRCERTFEEHPEVESQLRSGTGAGAAGGIRLRGPHEAGPRHLHPPAGYNYHRSKAVLLLVAQSGAAFSQWNVGPLTPFSFVFPYWLQLPSPQSGLLLAAQSGTASSKWNTGHLTMEHKPSHIGMQVISHWNVSSLCSAFTCRRFGLCYQHTKAILSLVAQSGAPTSQWNAGHFAMDSLCSAFTLSDLSWPVLLSYQSGATSGGTIRCTNLPMEHRPTDALTIFICLLATTAIAPKRYCY